MHKFTRPLHIGLPLCIAMLTACGGDGDKKSNTTPEVDYDSLVTTPQTENALVLANSGTVEEHIKNGIRLQLKNGNSFYYRDNIFPEGPPVPTTEAVTDNSGGNFTETNVHVDGVDEADYAKYDGKHWFVATYPEYSPYRIDNGPAIQIVETDPATPDARIVSEYKLDQNWGNVGEMYLVQQDSSTTHVAAIRNQWGNVRPFLPGFPEPLMAIDLAFDAILPYPSNSQVKIELVNVENPGAPQKDWEISLDGSLIDSRKIGNTLYLITRYDPWILELDYEFNGAVRDSNESKLEETSLSELMPSYQIGDQKAPLTDRCFLQSGTQDHHGFASLVHITAIDLASQKLLSSQCLNSNVGTLSMSLENLYLTGTAYENDWSRTKTVIHKFELTETGPEYSATGNVSGSLGWNSDPAFRLHEHNNDLRVVTSDWADGNPVHKLFVLEEREGVLNTIASLPNKERPAAIGKPQEDIYSVRFEGDKAYIVTFQRTDPMYAIDLSVRTDPKIAGELEVPGFASYIHPIGEDYVFTLGRNATEDGRVLGMKAELINVANGDPVVYNTVLLGGQGTYSEALSNLRALSILPLDNGDWRIAFPINLYANDEHNRTRWSYTGLQLLDIYASNTMRATLSDAGVIKASSSEKGDSRRSGIHRGIIHDDAVFYAYNNSIWVANWFNPQEAKGPIESAPIQCTANLVYGLEVTVTTPDEFFNACDADVFATSGNYHEQLVTNGTEGTSCTFYGAAERAGDYFISAEFPRLQAATQSVRVMRDECHVITEQVSIALEAQVCTAEVVDSLEVYVYSRTGDPCDAEVRTLSETGFHYLTPYPGDEPNGCVFRGPPEDWGKMDVQVSLDGHTPVTLENIYVPKNECHVETQTLRVYLDSELQ